MIELGCLGRIDFTTLGHRFQRWNLGSDLAPYNRRDRPEWFRATETEEGGADDGREPEEAD
jgi:hypothetical protein